MYNDLFTIGSVTIHTYGLMIGIGAVTAITYGCSRTKRKGLNDDFFFWLAIISLIGGLIGTKLLFCLTELKAIIADPSLIFSTQGFVVYGGIIGGVLTAIWFSHIKKEPFLKHFDTAMPLISLAMGFGRIGCFMAGCCYGKETDSIIGVTFRHSLFAPNNVKLIPVQLISSLGSFLIAVILINYDNKNKTPGKTGALFFVVYGVGRFLIEFLRNDYRGSVGIFSTSQFISLFIVAIGIAMYIILGKKAKNA